MRNDMIALLVCLIITFSVVYVIDWVNAPRNMAARFLSLLSGKEIAPSRINLPYLLQCSTCCTFWLCLITLLILNWKMAPMAFICSYMTKPTLYLFNVIDLLIDKVYKRIYNWISNL